MSTFIVYHGNCPDGWCAALIAKRANPDALLFPGTYGKPEEVLSLAAGHNLIMVDISFAREAMARIAHKARSILVLDHHKTAEAELAGLPWAIFDMKRSGATLAWDTFFGTPRPWYVDYVEDRDLWRWALPKSKEVSAYLMALPQTEEAWAPLDMMSVEQAVALGAAIRLHIDHYIEAIVAQRRMGRMAWHSAEKWADYKVGNAYRVAVVNAAYTNISDVCNVLCEKYADIGLGWFERGDGLVQFSLRSIGALDVSVIAKHFGGGGHVNAAGFQLPIPQARELLDGILRQ